MKRGHVVPQVNQAPGEAAADAVAGLPVAEDQFHAARGLGERRPQFGAVPAPQRFLEPGRERHGGVNAGPRPPAPGRTASSLATSAAALAPPVAGGPSPLPPLIDAAALVLVGLAVVRQREVPA
jgi:hypothetical protein